MLAALLGAVFVVIAMQAGSEVGEQRVHDVGYWLRKRWLALLVVIGVLVVGISLFDLPYASGERDGPDGREGDRRSVLLVAVARPGAGRNARSASTSPRSTSTTASASTTRTAT